MKNQLLLLGIAIFFVAKPQAQNLQHSEILGRPTDHGITVHTIFSEAAEVCIRYGTTSGNLTEQTNWQVIPAGEPAEIILENLSPDTKYYYRLCHRKPGEINPVLRPEYTFHTQRAQGSTFTFVVQADPHLDTMSDTALYRRCLENQLADRPDFMIDLGDIFMSDKMKNSKNQITRDTVNWRVRYMRGYYESVCHSLPLFIALGNHEGEAGWVLNGTAENVAVYGTLERKKYFINPQPGPFYTGDETDHPLIGQRENYYAWHWGDALFIVLDPYFYTKPKPDSLNGWRWTLGKTQYDWLKTTLETSKAPFKFVFAHQLVGGDPLGRGGIEFADKYEWGGQNLDGSDGWAVNRPGWYKPIKDLLTENRVTIFFHGHDHFFAKQDKNCLVYQLCPQPSLPVFTGPNQADDYGYFAGQILPNAGHLRLTVSEDGVKTEYIRAYLPGQETSSRRNRDVSASYYINVRNCYDSTATGTSVLWNSNYSDELIYPNPSSGEVNIAFTLKNAARIDIGIFDESGHWVQSLVSGQSVDAGNFQVSWNGCDNAGNKLPDGVYLYRISSDHGSTESGKILLHHH